MTNITKSTSLGLDLDPTHFGDAHNEGSFESSRVTSPDVNERPGSEISIENLIGAEEPLAHLKILVVLVVKYFGGNWVHIDSYAWVNIYWAHRL